MSLPARFWQKVEKTETCWLWKGGLRKGYGRFWMNGRYHTAHRLAWADDGRPLSGKKHRVLDHVKCNTKNCINPDHLREVSQAFNIWRHYNGG